MELRVETVNCQLHCRTCLANVTADQHGAVYLLNCSNGLRKWINDCLHPNLTVGQVEDDQHFPQQLCHECYEALRVASEFRTKVQQAEKMLVNEIPFVSPEHGKLSSCRICLRQYPQTVRSLIYHVRNAPHLKEWLVWSGAQTIIDEEWGAVNVVCRFCYSKLRDCYEWHLTAKETAEYLKGRVLSMLQPVWNNSQSIGVEQVDFADNFHVPEIVTIKEEEFSEYPDYPECADYIPTSSKPTSIANEVATSLLCLDVPYNVKGDFHCKSCATNFSNSILYENHVCPVNPFVSAEPLKCPFLNKESEKAMKSTQNSRNCSKKVCQQCQKRFNKSFLLEAHILQMHQGKKKPFLCKYCTHAYLTHTHLKRHIKNLHKQEWVQSFQDTTPNTNFCF